jgi:hypothetical protein
VAAGFATERWTIERIAALIEREFGVNYHPRSLERPLKAHGFSVQRPATRAKERDELVIAVWPKREWVALKRRAGSAGSSCSWMRPATASGRGRARRGLTPVLRPVSKRREVSSIVAITPDGRLYARHFRTSISSERVISALRFFRRKAARRCWWSGIGGMSIAHGRQWTSSQRTHRTMPRLTYPPMRPSLLIQRSSAVLSPSEPWPMRYRDQSPIYTAWPVANSVACKVNPK